MKWLVTGANGFIGTNLSDYLAEKNQHVYGFDNCINSPNERNEDRPNNQGTFLDNGPNIDSVESDVFVHLGAIGSIAKNEKYPWESFKYNVYDTIRTLEFFRRKNPDIHIILAGSSSMFTPDNMYGLSKKIVHDYADIYRKKYGMKITTLLLYNVFGPWQRVDHKFGAVIPRWIDNAMKDKPSIIYDPETTRDFTYVQEVCETIDFVAKNKILGTWDVCSGKERSLKELVEHFDNYFGPRLWQYSSRRSIDRPKSHSDRRIKKLIQRVGDFESNLVETFSWYETNISKVTF